MKIQLMSDVHVEFDRDQERGYGHRAGDAFIEALDETLCDVLVLAGDIGMAEYATYAVEKIAQKFWPKPVIWVHGNHEYYRTARPHMVELSRQLERENDNLTFLDKDVVEINGRRFLGCTLWYTDPGRYNWSDYRHIAGFGAWLPSEANDSRDFFRQNLKKDDIVITHMLPSERCVAARWAGNEDNRFFVHDLTHLIIEREPALWMFGHTHDKVDVKVGATRCVCNPRGYPFENPGFSKDFIIEV